MKRFYCCGFIALFLILSLVGCATNRPQVIVITSTFPPSEPILATDIPNVEPTVATQPSVVATSPPIAANASNEYVVQAGDTLSGIAVNNNVSLDLLLSVNSITDPNLLEVGQVIILPPPPSESTSSYQILPNSRLVRSQSANSFDIFNFLSSQSGFITSVTDTVDTRLDNGSVLQEVLNAGTVIQRVSLEYSIDPRIFLAFLEYYGRWLSQSNIPEDLKSHPVISVEQSAGFDRAGLYKQLSWLGNELNRGYYNWRYRGATLVELSDGTRQFYNTGLNAGTVALQYVLAINAPLSQWEYDISEAGFATVYRRYFGDPFADQFELIPAGLSQPTLQLPFVQGDVWRFTGGFHGGWGSGSSWAALDFAPPDDRSDGDAFCYISDYPVTAVANGKIARISKGVVVLDLDGDGNETTGWTILYLHMSIDPTLVAGQDVAVGDTLGYASCQGGFSTATHIHIARRYNGEWMPADCANCNTADIVPAFVMGDWRAVGLRNQEYQGYMVNLLDDRRAVAEQGRNVKINEISW